MPHARAPSRRVSPRRAGRRLLAMRRGRSPRGRLLSPPPSPRRRRPRCPSRWARRAAWSTRPTRPATASSTSPMRATAAAAWRCPTCRRASSWARAAAATACASRRPSTSCRRCRPMKTGSAARCSSRRAPTRSTGSSRSAPAASCCAVPATAADGSVLVATGTSRRALITIAGRGDRSEDAGSRRTVADAYVPAGATSFTVEGAPVVAAGDRIVVRRPSTAAWIAAIGHEPLPGMAAGEPAALAARVPRHRVGPHRDGGPGQPDCDRRAAHDRSRPAVRRRDRVPLPLPRAHQPGRRREPAPGVGLRPWPADGRGSRVGGDHHRQGRACVGPTGDGRALRRIGRSTSSPTRGR